MSTARSKWARYSGRTITILVVALAAVVLAHIAPECRTGRILLIADSRAPEQSIRLTVRYMPLGGNGSVQKVLWEGPAPKTPSFVNYAHRSEGSFSVDVRDAATGAWKSSLGGYIATSGETHVVLIGRDKIDYLSGFQSDFHRLQSSDASNLIYGAYHEVSDMLSCVDAGFALARMEEQNRIP